MAGENRYFRDKKLSLLSRSFENNGASRNYPVAPLYARVFMNLVIFLKLKGQLYPTSMSYIIRSGFFIKN